MQHFITAETVTLTLAKPFDYLSAGIAYVATPYADGSAWRVDRVDESGGTFLRPHQWQAMLAAGIATIGKA
jgi:hypothetical protein